MFLAMNKTPLAQCLRVGLLDRGDQTGAPSEMTSSGLARPRSFRSVRAPAQASVDSPLPGAKPMKAGLPPVVIPQAASTGSAGSRGAAPPSRSAVASTSDAQ